MKIDDFWKAHRERFLRIVGMFGSDADGERANAAAMATKMLREAELTWDEIFGGPAPCDLKAALERDRYRNQNNELRIRIATLEAEIANLRRAQRVPGKRIMSFAAALVELAAQIEARMELSEWEEGFIASMRGRNKLSEKQRFRLMQLADRAGVPCDFLDDE